ncbi:hypothetical protein B0H34DRAFT_671874 [Crassisporium funariophilum]|nr:hypothetical protein B0H34DRAFT_671874 [Crassisporium funariophilum]
MPSFTLVLTSNQGSLHGFSTTIGADPHAFSTFLPSAPADLMKTIDMRDDVFTYQYPSESTIDVSDDDNDSQTVFDHKKPFTSHGVPKKKISQSISKLRLLFVTYKFHNLKQKITFGRAAEPSRGKPS